MNRRRLRLVGGSLVVLFACLVLVGSTPGQPPAGVPCWQRVIADWSDNGRVDRTYPLACYRAAVKHLPEDLRAYSSAPDEIDRALAERRVALPAAARVAARPQTVPSQNAGRAGMRLALLVPPAAGVLVAAGVGLWLVRARGRPAGGR